MKIFFGLRGGGDHPRNKAEEDAEEGKNPPKYTPELDNRTKQIQPTPKNTKKKINRGGSVLFDLPGATGAIATG